MTHNDHRARREARIVTTSTGLRIGGAYVPPPAPIGVHAEAIQSALLGSSFPGSRRVSKRIERASVIHTDNSWAARVMRAIARWFR